MEIRKSLEEREELLAEKAAKSRNSTRQRPEKESSMRTSFQRDRDRILHSKSFRRLKHKTQVFIAPEGDHFRTRLTHTLEVSQIARTIAKALNLNEDLAEAIALGHDLGHTPFGHTGEKVISQLEGCEFKHFEQSLRVVDKLEYHGKGLNLTDEVRDGIIKHSKGSGAIISRQKSTEPKTLEGQIVRISDIIAYVNHDIDDAKRAGIVKRENIPASSLLLLGATFAKRIDTIVKDVINCSLKNDLRFINLSDNIYGELNKLRDFLYKNVYWREEATQEREKIKRMITLIYNYLKEQPDKYINPYPPDDPLNRRIIDFISGMTDNYAVNFVNHILFPTQLS